MICVGVYGCGFVSSIKQKPWSQWLDTWHSSSPQHRVEAYWYRFKRSRVRVRVRELALICVSRECTFFLFCFVRAADLSRDWRRERQSDCESRHSPRPRDVSSSHRPSW